MLETKQQHLWYILLPSRNQNGMIHQLSRAMAEYKGTYNLLSYYLTVEQTIIIWWWLQLECFYCNFSPFFLYPIQLYFSLKIKATLFLSFGIIIFIRFHFIFRFFFTKKKCRKTCLPVSRISILVFFLFYSRWNLKIVLFDGVSDFFYYFYSFGK